MAQAANINGDKIEDVGTVLNTLDNAWEKTEQLPVFRRNVCPRDQKTGLHFVNLTLMGSEVSRIRVLGTGKANPPIEYPFFRQVALQ